MLSKLQKQTILPTRNEFTHNNIANSFVAEGSTFSVPFGDGGNPSPSGEDSFCDRVNNPEPPSPLRGEGWDEGDKGSSSSTPTLTLPPRRGRGLLGMSCAPGSLPSTFSIQLLTHSFLIIKDIFLQSLQVLNPVIDLSHMVSQ